MGIRMRRAMGWVEGRRGACNQWELEWAPKDLSTHGLPWVPEGLWRMQSY